MRPKKTSNVFGSTKAGGIKNGPFSFVAEARNFLSKPHQKLLSLAIIKNAFLIQIAPQTSNLDYAVFLTYLQYVGIAKAASKSRIY